jgi:hypothetical protein
MLWPKVLMGKVFISHSSLDKPVVRQISEAIEKAGFAIWLDEHELLPGDPLAERISEALANAKVVIVVVSENSLKSKWLKFELNKAADLMIQGKCRLIPAVIDNSALPPEVLGLLYADFTKNFEYGITSIISALKHEFHRVVVERGFWARTEVSLQKIFGPSGSVSILGEFRSTDYSILTVPVPSSEEEETAVVYEIVSGYSMSEKPLGPPWWDDFSHTITEYPEFLFLVVTERPVSFPVDTSVSEGIHIIKNYTRGIPNGTVLSANVLLSAFVIVDLHNVTNESVIEERLHIAREALITLAHEIAGR